MRVELDLDFSVRAEFNMDSGQIESIMLNTVGARDLKEMSLEDFIWYALGHVGFLEKVNQEVDKRLSGI